MTVIYIVLALTFFVSVHSKGWDYSDPSTWGKSFAACNGNSQSPINIISAKAKYDDSLGEFELTGFETKMAQTIVNNGHTIQVNIKNTVISRGGGLQSPYKALQFHFHWSANKETAGSEHLMNNKAYPLEVHIVHMNQNYPNITEALKYSDGLAVLGFFFKVGDENPAVSKFINKLPDIGVTSTSEEFSLAELLGSLDDLEDYYRYQGSLTTPPCSQAVVWTVFKKVLTISKSQLNTLWTVKDHDDKMYSNYRPIQKLNDRDIYTSIKSSEWSYDDTESWGNEFKDCTGDSQSPINIITSNVVPDVNLPPIEFFHYGGEKYFEMVNTGHSLQLNFAKTESLIMSGRLPNIFQALQFHFHWNANSRKSGSEHQINGRPFPVEMHIVHKNLKYSTPEEAIQNPDGLAVLGFFFKLSKTPNPEMDKFLTLAKTVRGDNTANVSLDLSKLIGLNGQLMGDFYRYSGSLTTPPCSQAVIWSVFRRPIKMSMKQLKLLWKVKGHNRESLENFRPIRPLNGRTISCNP